MPVQTNKQSLFKACTVEELLLLVDEQKEEELDDFSICMLMTPSFARTVARLMREGGEVVGKTAATVSAYYEILQAVEAVSSSEEDR